MSRRRSGWELEHRGPVAVTLEHGPGAVLESGQLRKEFPAEQVRRRRDLAVADADDGRRAGR